MGREGGGDSTYPKTVMEIPGAENKKGTEEIFEEKKMTENFPKLMTAAKSQT